MRWLVIVSVYVVASVVAFGVFAVDKRAARTGGRRVAERSLHLAELLGGWPGALVAIFGLRHKNRKWSFLLVTAAIVLLHLAAWAVVWRTMA